LTKILITRSAAKLARAIGKKTRQKSISRGGGQVVKIQIPKSVRAYKRKGIWSRQRLGSGDCSVGTDARAVRDHSQNPKKPQGEGDSKHRKWTQEQKRRQVLRGKKKPIHIEKRTGNLGSLGVDEQCSQAKKKKRHPFSGKCGQETSVVMMGWGAIAPNGERGH